MSIKELESRYFGRDKTKRYMLEVYRECVDKIITANVLFELTQKHLEREEHTQGHSCQECLVLNILADSCTDSLYLHLRVLFSKQEPDMAYSFLNDVTKLKFVDFEEYFKNKYTYDFKESALVDTLTDTAEGNLGRISRLYLARIEPYQKFAFHQQENETHYKVSSQHTNLGGLKIIKNTRKKKYRQDISAARDMLEAFSQVVHEISKLACMHDYRQTYLVTKLAESIINLVDIETLPGERSRIIQSTKDNTSDIVHIFECGSGLNRHNQLVFMQIHKIMQARETSVDDWSRESVMP